MILTGPTKSGRRYVHVDIENKFGRVSVVASKFSEFEAREMVYLKLEALQKDIEAIKKEVLPPGCTPEDFPSR